MKKCYLILFSCINLMCINSNLLAYNYPFVNTKSNLLDSALMKDLLRMEDMDQQYRNSVDSVEKVYGRFSKESDVFVAKIMNTDSLNTRHLVEIIEKYGWPGKTLCGEKGSHAAWLLLQHADTTTQSKYLPLLKEAADKGEASMQDYAYLLDRVLIHRKQPQIYGTQVFYNEDSSTYMLHKVQDPENLDQRRLALGMIKIDDYLYTFSHKYSFLGVQVQLLSDSSASRLSLEKGKGLLITDVESGSPAELAGLQTYDVLVKVDEFPMNSFAELFSYISRKATGDVVKISILRNGNALDLNAALKSR